MNIMLINTCTTIITFTITTIVRIIVVVIHIIMYDDSIVFMTYNIIPKIIVLSILH